jgi:hypothetical protein
MFAQHIGVFGFTAAPRNVEAREDLDASLTRSKQGLCAAEVVQHAETITRALPRSTSPKSPAIGGTRPVCGQRRNRYIVPDAPRMSMNSMVPPLPALPDDEATLAGRCVNRGHNPASTVLAATPWLFR